MTIRRIGILGGMGPLATADLYLKIIRATPANVDQEHLPVVIDADPRVPDRTAALLEGGEDPLPWLIRSARRLNDAGADFIVIPCNTAHAFIDQLRAATTLPVISMVDESVREVQALVAAGSRVGILATSGTISAGLYQHALNRLGLAPLVPDESHQHLVMKTIYAVKSGETSDAAAVPVREAASALEAQSVAGLLAACTELPVVLKSQHLTVPLVDPTAALARAAIRLATDDSAFSACRDQNERAHTHAS